MGTDFCDVIDNQYIRQGRKARYKFFRGFGERLHFRIKSGFLQIQRWYFWTYTFWDDRSGCRRIDGASGDIVYGFCGFIKSPKIKTVTDEEGTVIEEKVIENEYLYGLRYEEFIAPIIKTIQLQQKEINALNERINKLEGGISWN